MTRGCGRGTERAGPRGEGGGHRERLRAGGPCVCRPARCRRGDLGMTFRRRSLFGSTCSPGRSMRPSRARACPCKSCWVALASPFYFLPSGSRHLSCGSARTSSRTAPTFAPTASSSTPHKPCCPRASNASRCTEQKSTFTSSTRLSPSAAAKTRSGRNAAQNGRRSHMTRQLRHTHQETNGTFCVNTATRAHSTSAGTRQTRKRFYSGHFPSCVCEQPPAACER